MKPCITANSYLRYNVLSLSCPICLLSEMIAMKIGLFFTPMQIKLIITKRICT